MLPARIRSIIHATTSFEPNDQRAHDVREAEVKRKVCKESQGLEVTLTNLVLFLSLAYVHL